MSDSLSEAADDAIAAPGPISVESGSGLTAEIECEARDGGQIDRLVENLRTKGYVVELAELA